MPNTVFLMMRLICKGIFLKWLSLVYAKSCMPLGISGDSHQMYLQGIVGSPANESIIIVFCYERAGLVAGIECLLFLDCSIFVWQPIWHS